MISLELDDELDDELEYTESELIALKANNYDELEYTESELLALATNDHTSTVTTSAYLLGNEQKQFKGMEGTKPFVGHRIYGPTLHKKINRYYVSIIDISNEELKSRDRPRKNMLYSRFIMCMHLGRILDTLEEVDHKDNNKLNDLIYNLQVIFKNDHNAKTISDNNSSRAMVNLRCPNPECRVAFQKYKNQTHLAKGGVFSTCSIECRTIFSSMLKKFGQNVLIAQMIKENVIQFYRKNDKIELMK